METSVSSGQPPGSEGEKGWFCELHVHVILLGDLTHLIIVLSVSQCVDPVKYGDVGIFRPAARLRRRKRLVL